MSVKIINSQNSLHQHIPFERRKKTFMKPSLAVLHVKKTYLESPEQSSLSWEVHLVHLETLLVEHPKKKINQNHIQICISLIKAHKYLIRCRF